MSTENDFLAFASGPDANVLSQDAYASLSNIIQNGFQAGIAPSIQLNKVWRQSSIMAAVLAQFIVDETGQPAIDDGTTATLLANLKSAFPGRLLGINMYATAGATTFQPQTTKSQILVFAQGGAGAGGSTPATGSGQIALAQGGASGGFSIGFYALSTDDPIVINIGNGGTPVAGSAGGSGNTTSVGSLFEVYGGAGGQISGVLSTATSWATGVSQTVAPLGTANLVNNQGTTAPIVVTASGVTYAGAGAPGWFGGGPASQSAPINTAGVAGVLGGGGRGCAQNASGAALLGGQGGPGWVLIFEFGSM